MPSFYQDRLGTNIGKTQKRVAFCAEIDVPSYVDRREGEELHLMVAVPKSSSSQEEEEGGEEEEEGGTEARVMYVEPRNQFLYSFVIDPNGEVASGLLQLTETGAELQPCGRDPPNAAAAQTRFEWNSSTVEMKNYELWNDLNRAF